MSWQERRCNAEGFGRPEPFFFLCEERTYSPPAKQAVVSLPLVGHGALRGGFRFLRKAMDDAGKLLSSTQQARDGTKCSILTCSCTNLPPAALPQIWVHRSADASIFSFAKEKQKLEVRDYGNLPFGSEGYQQRRRPLCCGCRSLYELQRDL